MKKLIVVILVAIGIGAVAHNKDQWFKDAEKLIAENRLGSSFSKLLEQESTLPKPLRMFETVGERSFLVDSGVVALTNAERTKLGVPALKENSKLALAAKAKLEDMFAKQYFEHISPAGVGPSDLAKQQGYAYITVGENLALGNFEDNNALVQAWMNSPGHRANILNSKYTEIGVAVGQGTFEGKQTWLAVQEFGAPLSSCPGVDGNLKNIITVNETKITEMDALAKNLKQKFDSSVYNNDPGVYNEKVREYNELVNKLNALIEEAKTLVASYNKQVNSFNACIKK